MLHKESSRRQTERKKALRKTALKMDGHGEQRLNKNRSYLQNKFEINGKEL